MNEQFIKPCSSLLNNNGIFHTRSFSICYVNISAENQEVVPIVPWEKREKREI